VLIVGIFCGLASQMNQYAFARVLKRRFPGTDVRLLDACEWMKDSGHNGYELDRLFGIFPDSVERSLVRRLANFHPGYGLVAKFFNGLHQIRDRVVGPKKTQIMMNDIGPDSDILERLDVSRDWLFWGNAQMWPFDEVSDELRCDFSFRMPLKGRNKEVSQEMMSCNSVSVHVRRGDYARFGYRLLGREYYQRAIAEIERRMSNARYYVFSDDLAESKRLFSGILSDVVYVEGNSGPESYVDMRLMSLCRAHIIANSGFSTLAAWLDDRPDKIVVCPSSCPEIGGVNIVVQ